MKKQESKIYSDIKRLENMKDSEIDYSDIPETDEAFWADAEVVMPKNKVHVSIRLDSDIVDWFKKRGRGYQSRINAVLKSYIEHNIGGIK